MGAEVPATRTPVTQAQAASYVVDGLRAKLNREPTEQEAVFTWALAMVETANGQSVVQNNAGNVSCFDDGRGWSGDYWRPPWFNEQHDPKYSSLHRAMLEGKAPRAFRAYPSQQAGWNDFAREVARRTTLLQAMNSDDPAQVVQQLHDTNYSKDYGEKHVATFRSLAASARAAGWFAGLPKGETPSMRMSSGVGLGLGLGLTVMIVFGLMVSYGKKRR
jgi:hypothetical protein